MPVENNALIASRRANNAGICASGSGATGIPTVDVAAIAQGLMNHLETMANHEETITTTEKNHYQVIEQWVEQLNKMQAQYKKLEETLTAMKGAKKFGDKLAALGKLPKYADIKKIVDFLNEQYRELYKKIRGKYPDNGNTPKANELFDKLAQQEVAYEHYHSDIQARIERLNELMKQIDAAEDPGDKADLANRIAIEQAAIEASMAQYDIFTAWMNKEIKISKKEADEEWRCKQSNGLACKGEGK